METDSASYFHATSLDFTALRVLKTKKKVLKLLITVVFWPIQIVYRQPTLNKVIKAWLQGKRYISGGPGLVLSTC